MATKFETCAKPFTLTLPYLYNSNGGGGGGQKIFYSAGHLEKNGSFSAIIKYSLAQLGEETLVCGREINAMEVLKHSHS